MTVIGGVDYVQQGVNDRLEDRSNLKFLIFGGGFCARESRGGGCFTDFASVLYTLHVLRYKTRHTLPRSLE